MAVAIAAVARAAGRAMIAAEGYEPSVRMNPNAAGAIPGSFRPIQHWRMSLDQPWFIKPSYVLESAEQIIGNLEAEADKKASRETTLAGRVGMIFGFPASVREVVIDQFPNSASKGAKATGMVAAVTTGVLETVIAAGIVWAATLGYNAIFGEPATTPTPTPSVSVSTIPNPTPSIAPGPSAPTSVPASITP